MRLTTKDIIKTLPFASEFQKQLLEGFDSLDADKKFEIEQILWDSYDALFQIKLEENLELATIEAEVGNVALDQDFYKKAQEKTEKEMKSNFHEETKDMDLSAIREKLQAYMTPNDGSSPS